MKNLIPALLFAICIRSLPAQTNIISTNSLAEQLMLGNYDPASYMPLTVINDPASISQGINNEINPDSLKSYLEILATFQNRNTGSDTMSSTTGIGAARNWVYSKFQQFSGLNQNRLIPSFLKFDLAICSMNQHKNIFAVLPGADTTDKSIVLVEGHIDSRCSVLCDISCLAQGMEDNGSGTALVLELARVMSKYSFNHTLVFLITIGEEQGLYGAEAFADYVKTKGIEVKSVFNNDVIGGIICGQTSSPPSCPGLNDIDSTQVRLFSFGGFNSFHKGLSRYIKLQYKELLLPIVRVPMLISIMTAEDRTGRGGDHIPFRQHSYAAMRFTSANEHGDASNSVGYTDRQHTSADILGVDTDSDLVLDSFYVDFNYLSRNAVINGVAAGMIGISPQTPDFTVTSDTNSYTIQITGQTQYLKYRIGVRSLTNDWDTVYTLTGSLSASIPANPGSTYYVSVASVNGNDVESLFSREQIARPLVLGINEFKEETGLELLQNKPNPFDESTMISVKINKAGSYKSAFIKITDIHGKLVRSLPISLKGDIAEVLYEHGYNASGIYTYTLVIDDKEIESKKMIFTN